MKNITNISKKSLEISELDSVKLELLSLKRNQALANFKQVDAQLTEFAMTLFKAADLCPQQYSVDFATRKFVKIDTVGKSTSGNPDSISK